MPLYIHLDSKEGWNYAKEQFVYVEEQDLELEHCLLAIAMWESKWKESFFNFITGEKRSTKKMLSYIWCMALNPKLDEDIVYSITPEQQKQIVKYIEEDQTATTVMNTDGSEAHGNEFMTSELIYYNMSQVPLPFDVCERWHLSRLLITLRVASEKSKQALNHNKKMPSHKVANMYRDLNNARRARTGSRG